jgi:hypothetical protein
MSALRTNAISDHQVERERPQHEDSRPISAEPGARTVNATRVAVVDGRVVFRPDVPLWVYRSYPLAISTRSGGAGEPRMPAWTFRGILVEPMDLRRSDEFKDCSVVYAIAPSVAAWWESAPFSIRHAKRIEYDQLETSLMSFPDGCVVEALGDTREAAEPVRPVAGTLRDGVVEKRRVDAEAAAGERVSIRSALMLDPLRLAPEWVTGRRSRIHAKNVSGKDAGEGEGAETWHWSVVPNLEETVETLLKDPELDRFRESVMNADETFLARWYSSAMNVPAPSGPRDYWSEKDRALWLLPDELRNGLLVDALLREAALYALAGPVDFDSYLAKCQGWSQTERREALTEAGEPLVFPLVQNVFVNWLDALHRRLLEPEHFEERSKKRKVGRTRGPRGVKERLDAVDENRRIAKAKLKLLGADEDFLNTLRAALMSLASEKDASTSQAPLDEEEFDEEDERKRSKPRDRRDALRMLTAAVELLEERLLQFEKRADLNTEERDTLALLKHRLGRS